MTKTWRNGAGKFAARSLSAWVALALVMGLVMASPAQGSVVIEVGSTNGAPGDDVVVAVRLFLDGEAVAATENEVAGAGGLRFVDCKSNPALGKNLTSFALMPLGCEVGVTCDRVRAIVLGLNLDPIPSGSVLYTCTVRVAADAGEGSLPLQCLDPSASGTDTPANPLATECSDGSVDVMLPEMCVGDGDGDHVVTISELVSAVNNLLDGCP